MGYAILRTQKLKSVVAVRRSLKHAFRDQDTPNADPARAQDNTHIGANGTDGALAKVAALLPEKRRSDAVLCIEYLVTASPQDMAGKSREEQDTYLMDSLEWIRKRHGAENVVYAGIHRDETTPHLYAYAVPLDKETGRLNAKKWLGGARALSEMQSDFAERVGKQHGLQRGIEGSKAKHTSIKDWYAQVERSEPVPRIEVPEPGMADRLNPRAYGERVAKSVLDQMQPERASLSAKAATATTDRQKAKELTSTLEDQQRRLRPVMEALRGLQREDQSKVVQVMRQVAAEVRQRRAGAAEKSQEKPRQKPGPDVGKDRD